MGTAERRPLAAALIAPAAVLAALFTAVRPTNFGGHDEWLVLSLASRGIIDFPYASRPLALLWSVPLVTAVLMHTELRYYALPRAVMWLTVAATVLAAFPRPAAGSRSGPRRP